MVLDRNNNKEVAVQLGAGSMGTAILRRVAAGKKILLGGRRQSSLDKAADSLRYSGYDVETFVVNAVDPIQVRAFAEKAAALGPVKIFIDTAGASPSQATPEEIIKLDLIGTAYALDIFGEVMAPGGAGVIISSMTGYMPHHLTPEDENALAMTPTEKLAELPCLASDKITNSGIAYIVSKRCNHLRVRTAAATGWAKHGARINSISPGIIVTPLAYDEFNAPGTTYQSMIDTCSVKRAGTSDEIAAAGAYLLGPDAGFVTGTDLLIDGGTIAALKSGLLNLSVQ